ncbi:hypothetical protein X759_20665 [Mesorhizobium sp. LSHC420B00]|nr:hypothetical protein X759_20665 [Mesorhizobium sp. LSHC420B00]
MAFPSVLLRDDQFGDDTTLVSKYGSVTEVAVLPKP